MGLRIMFLGNYETEEPPETLMKSFKNLIEFGVNLGKIDVNYNVYGNLQFKPNSSQDRYGPGKALMNLLMSEFNGHFDSHGLGKL